MVTAAEFVADYPEFAAVDTDATGRPNVTRALARADALISNSAFGALRDDALELYAAHRLAVRYKASLPGLQNQAMPGVLTSQQANNTGGSIQATVSALVSSDSAWNADLAQTRYGLQYLALIDASICPMASAAQPPALNSQGVGLLDLILMP
jgi:hypothetical protein